jgi:hypothetical protein
VNNKAEVRSIAEPPLRPNDRIKLGSLLAAIRQGSVALIWKIARDKTPVEPASFS